MLEWLIVGGGVHGTHLSLHLTRALGIARDRVRVLDPHPEPLARWEACTRNTGMAFLRSPYVHQIDLPAYSLMAFAKSRAGRPFRRFTEPYYRPGTALFRAHVQHVVQTHGLADLRVVGSARGMSACAGGIRIETERGSLESRRVLLALSAGDMPRWPAWGRAMREVGAPIDHVFDPGFDREKLPAFGAAVVVGGGITAAQVALALADRAPGKVTLVTPHAPRVHQFDSDPGWIGPKFLDGYHREADMDRRRAVIRAARNRGSMPPDVAGQLRRASARGALAVRVAQVTEASLEGDAVRLHGEGGETIDADRVILATGFEGRRPGGEWLDRAIMDLGLRCASCGYPIVDERLQWHPGIHVTGALAELELGPTARNIIGARLAAERITA
jgi:hypothetical protein